MKIKSFYTHTFFWFVSKCNPFIENILRELFLSLRVPVTRVCVWVPIKYKLYYFFFLNRKLSEEWESKWPVDLRFRNKHQHRDHFVLTTLAQASNLFSQIGNRLQCDVRNNKYNLFLITYKSECSFLLSLRSLLYPFNVNCCVHITICVYVYTVVLCCALLYVLYRFYLLVFSILEIDLIDYNCQWHGKILERHRILNTH